MFFSWGAKKKNVEVEVAIDRSALKPPTTYSEWVSLIEKFKKKEDEDDVLNAMSRGRLNWQMGVAERFVKQLSDASAHRMKLASDRFQRELSHANGHDGVIVQSLIALRKDISSLYRLGDIPALPEDLRTQIKDCMREQANEIQNSIEQSAKWDRTGRIASIIRNNRVNNF